MIEISITEVTRKPSVLRSALAEGDVRITWKRKRPNGEIIFSALAEKETKIVKKPKAADFLLMEIGHYKVSDQYGNKSIAFWSGEHWQFISDPDSYLPTEIDLEIHAFVGVN